jgi:DNA mismatch endonuclease (patch repair protein)
LRSFLIRNRIKGWRLNVTDLTGNPDFVFKEIKVVVFVDGCFWHGCPQCGHVPKTDTKYWQTKILRNRTRDRIITQHLRSGGFKVIRIWECVLRKRPDKCVKEVLEAIAKQS